MDKIKQNNDEKLKEIFSNVRDTILNNIKTNELPKDDIIARMKFQELSNLNSNQVSELIKSLCPSIQDSVPQITSVINKIIQYTENFQEVESSLKIEATKSLFMDNIDNNVKAIISIIDPYGKKISFFENGMTIDSTPLGFVIMGLINIQSDFDYIDIRENLQSKFSIYINPFSVKDEFYRCIARVFMCSQVRIIFDLLFNHPLVKSLYGDRSLLRQLFSDNNLNDDETYYMHTLFISNYYEILKEISNSNFISKEGFKFEIEKNIVNKFYDNYIRKEN